MTKPEPDNALDMFVRLVTERADLAAQDEMPIPVEFARRVAVEIQRLQLLKEGLLRARVDAIVDEFVAKTDKRRDRRARKHRAALR